MKMPSARSQWGAAVRDGRRRFWRRSATIAQRGVETAACNDERASVERAHDNNLISPSAFVSKCETAASKRGLVQAA